MASDSPESLMTLCTDYCLRNLEGTLCYLLDNETLQLHPDIFLPSEICDKLVNEYVSGLLWEGAGSSEEEYSSPERIRRAAFFQLIVLANKGLCELQREVLPFLLLSF